MNLYNNKIEASERGRAIQFAKRGVQWFAERVLQYILQYFYNISVPCFSSLLSQNKGILLVLGTFCLQQDLPLFGELQRRNVVPSFGFGECDREVPLFE